MVRFFIVICFFSFLFGCSGGGEDTPPNATATAASPPPVFITPTPDNPTPDQPAVPPTTSWQASPAYSSVVVTEKLDIICVSWEYDISSALYLKGFRLYSNGVQEVCNTDLAITHMDCPLSNVTGPLDFFTLTAYDNYGNESAHSSPMYVNYAPKAVLGAEKETTASMRVSFNGSASTDQDGTIAGYYWEFGDNTTSTEAIVDHDYLPGDYDVRLTVTDDKGAQGDVGLTITIE